MARGFIATLALVAAAALAPAAAADGGLAAGEDVGWIGVTVPGSDVRYAAVPAERGTMVLEIGRADGQLLAWHFLRQRVTFPSVAVDRTATGVSADGRTLMLAQPRTVVGRRHSRFVVLRGRGLRRHAVIDLRGDFTLDALSPDGRIAYLVQYTSPRDPTRYAVRAYDIAHRRLRPEAVIDPREPDEDMSGTPLARAMSPDGRWAYTLYDGNGSHPFIHALDTAGAEARCIDLDELAGRRDILATGLTVAPDGTLTVRDLRSQRPLVTVDPRTFAVSKPAQAQSKGRPAEAERPSAPPADDGGTPWAILGVGGALAAIGGAAVGRRRRRASRRAAAPA